MSVDDEDSLLLTRATCDDELVLDDAEWLAPPGRPPDAPPLTRTERNRHKQLKKRAARDARRAPVAAATGPCPADDPGSSGGDSAALTDAPATTTCGGGVAPCWPPEVADELAAYIREHRNAMPHPLRRHFDADPLAGVERFLTAGDAPVGLAAWWSHSAATLGADAASCAVGALLAHTLKSVLQSR